MAVTVDRDGFGIAIEAAEGCQAGLIGWGPGGSFIFVTVV